MKKLKLKKERLYSFSKIHFNIPDSDRSLKSRQQYAISIVEAIKVLKDCNQNQNFEPITNYLGKPKGKRREVTFNFLTHLDNFLTYNKKIFEHINYTQNSVNTLKLIIEYDYFLDTSKSEIILLTFGPINIQEANILNSFNNYYKLEYHFPKNLKNITFWNLTNGSEEKISINELKLIPKISIENTLDKLLNNIKK